MLKSHKKILIGLLACSVVTFSSCEILDRLSGGGSDTQTVSDPAVANTSNEETEAAEAAESTSAEPTEEETQETTAEPTDEAGGNPEDGNSFALEVTVSENTYLYDNHEISYEELIEIFDSLNKEDVVKLSDDNASLDAYSKLTAALEERGISYLDDDGELHGKE